MSNNKRKGAAPTEVSSGSTVSELFVKSLTVEAEWEEKASHIVCIFHWAFSSFIEVIVVKEKCQKIIMTCWRKVIAYGHLVLLFILEVSIKQ